MSEDIWIEHFIFATKFLIDAWFWPLYQESLNTGKWPEMKGIKWSLFKTKITLKRFSYLLRDKTKYTTYHDKFDSDASLSLFKEEQSIKPRLSSVFSACASTHLSLSRVGTLVNQCFHGSCPSHLPPHIWPSESAFGHI